MPEQSSSPGDRNSTVTWIGVLVIAAGFFIWLFFFRPRTDGNSGIAHSGVGKSLTALQLEPLTGDGPAVTRESLQGKVALINFWGTWCPPCVQEFPYLAALEKSLRLRENFVYLSVSCSRSGDELTQLDDLRAETKQFLDRQKVTHATYFDPADVTRRPLSNAGIFSGYPTTIILDRAGVIRGVWVGYRPGVDQEMLALINTLLVEAVE